MNLRALHEIDEHLGTGRTGGGRSAACGSKVRLFRQRLARVSWFFATSAGLKGCSQISNWPALSWRDPGFVYAVRRLGVLTKVRARFVRGMLTKDDVGMPMRRYGVRIYDCIGRKSFHPVGGFVCWRCQYRPLGSVGFSSAALGRQYSCKSQSSFWSFVWMFLDRQSDWVL